MRGINMNLSFGTEMIYEDAEFHISRHDKVGVVGVNGSGKTTLFRVILQEQELDDGHIFTDNARIGYLPQEVVLDDGDLSVWDYLLTGRPLKALEAELGRIYEALASETGEQGRLLKRMAALQEQLEYYDCYEAEGILLEIVENMQIDPALLGVRLAELSGGQKSKIAFARVLYSKADLLLLDEPTNHLDASTKAFVTGYLRQYKGMVLIISHDIDFLNQIINKVLYVNKVTHKILIYKGDYHTFQQKYAQDKRLREQSIVHQEKAIRELENLVQKARQASQTNHHLKRLGQERAARLEKKRRELQERERIYKRVKMDLRPGREGGAIPLTVEHLTFGYPGRDRLYEDLSFAIKRKERFLVVGENGTGKSTLLKLLVGRLVPGQGDIRCHAGTDVAYYAQELELIDSGKTVLENVETPGYSVQQLRAALSNFLFYGDDVYKPCAVLSPGERARVSLCKVLLQRANLLILDEPTNHLDPETQEILGRNFRTYPGTIIAVSHSPSFASQIGISRILVLPGGQIEPYSRELLEYYYKRNSKPEL